MGILEAALPQKAAIAFFLKSLFDMALLFGPSTASVDRKCRKDLIVESPGEFTQWKLI